MPKLTMKQFMRANNVALAYGLDPRKLIEALQQTLETTEVLAVPQDVTEDLFYKVLRWMV